jgi:hypothetical protein
LLSKADIGGYKLSQVQIGEDSIIESVIVEQPDFDNQDMLRKQIEDMTIDLAENIASMLK